MEAFGIKKNEKITYINGVLGKTFTMIFDKDEQQDANDLLEKKKQAKIECQKLKRKVDDYDDKKIIRDKELTEKSQGMDDTNRIILLLEKQLEMHGKIIKAIKPSVKPKLVNGVLTHINSWHTKIKTECGEDCY